MAETGGVQRDAYGHHSKITQLLWSPNGQRIISVDKVKHSK